MSEKEPQPTSKVPGENSWILFVNVLGGLVATLIDRNLLVGLVGFVVAIILCEVTLRVGSLVGFLSKFFETRNRRRAMIVVSAVATIAIVHSIPGLKGRSVCAEGQVPDLKLFLGEWKTYSGQAFDLPGFEVYRRTNVVGQIDLEGWSVPDGCVAQWLIRLNENAESKGAGPASIRSSLFSIPLQGPVEVIHIRLLRGTRNGNGAIQWTDPVSYVISIK